MKREQDNGGVDPRVQAFVDSELDDDERAEFRRRMSDEPALAAEVRRLASIKNALRDAYATTPVATPAVPSRRGGRRAAALAAMLVVGVMLGFGATRLGSSSPPPAGPDAGATAMTRVLLHVGRDDAAAMAEALTSARYILEDFAASGRPVRVHVVANGPGLDLFRRGVTPFAGRIGELERRFANIQFVACQNTIDKVEKRLGEPVVLLPEVLRVDSGVADIARKRAGGWLYIGV